MQAAGGAVALIFTNYNSTLLDPTGGLVTNVARHPFLNITGLTFTGQRTTHRRAIAYRSDVCVLDLLDMVEDVFLRFGAGCCFLRYENGCVIDCS